MRHITLLLAVLVMLAGCGTVRALAGADPALLSSASDIASALNADTAAHPENKAKNDKALAALRGAVDPQIPPGDAAAVSAVNPWLGLAFTAVTGGLLTWLGKRNKAASDAADAAAAAAINHHAGLIDSLTPPTADDAAKVG